MQAGVFFHNSQDLRLKGGALADNSVQADLDKADNIVVTGTKIIGTTTRYGEIVSTQPGNLAHDGNIIGVDLHSYATDMINHGATIRNVRFSGFPLGHVIEVDEKRWSGHFDYWQVKYTVEWNSSFLRTLISHTAVTTFQDNTRGNTHWQKCCSGGI